MSDEHYGKVKPVHPASEVPPPSHALQFYGHLKRVYCSEDHLDRGEHIHVPLRHHMMLRCHEYDID